MTLEILKNQIGAKENYEIPEKLMNYLLNSDLRLMLFDEIKNNFDLSKDSLRDLFQNELSERSTLKQDYTPDCICEIISKIIPKQAVKIADICCVRHGVELVLMDDPQAPPIGTKGTVRGVDDIGSIMVAWDNGCGLSVAYGADICRKVGDADAQ